VGKIFKQLGFLVTEGLPGRDGLILKYKDKVAVVEVKGVTKSAAEKHAAQLEKWVSEYYSTYDIRPKGILVVNAFKDTPLINREEQTFPDQMISYCRGRNHCLLSGVQLLGIFLYCLCNHTMVDNIIEQIFSTDGVLDGFNNWKDFISISS
jgi:hypothetical protein